MISEVLISGVRYFAPINGLKSENVGVTGSDPRTLALFNIGMPSTGSIFKAGLCPSFQIELSKTGRAVQCTAEVHTQRCTWRV